MSLAPADRKPAPWVLEKRATERRRRRGVLLSLLFIIFMAHCLDEALQGCGPTANDASQSIRKHSRTVLSLWWSPVLSAEAVRIIRLEAPLRPLAGTPARLRCVYETRGDKLQSLSWYKDGREFYRYQPYERSKPVITFNQTGVTVDLSRSKNNSIVLTNTTTDTSGRYKCEVTVNTFQEVNMATNLEFQTASSGRLHPPALVATVLPPLVALIIPAMLWHHHHL